MVYFVSDTHFNHTNIIKYCDRPFADVSHMNETIISNWNDTVKDDDVIYHLGDLALGRKEYMYDIAKRLKGKKYLVKGNHDKWGNSTYEEFGFTVLKNPPIVLDEYKVVLSHVPIPDNMIPNGYVNLHGHIHNKELYDCPEGYDPGRYSVKRHINLSCDKTEFKPVSIEWVMEVIWGKNDESKI